MIDDALTNELKSLLDACCQLQGRMGGDAKAVELLHCSRSLLTRLVIEASLGAQLSANAQAQYATLQVAIDKFGIAENTQQDVLAKLHAVHAALARLNLPEASVLCRQLVKIEAGYVEAVEKAFRAQMATSPSQQAAAKASYDKESLARFLANAFLAPRLTVKSIDIISGGFSKLTLKAEVDGGAGATSVPSSLILRCDLPAGTAFVGTQIEDEYPILQTVFRHGVRVPQPYAMDASGKVIGVTFIALSRAAGGTVGTLFEFPPANPELARDVAQQLALIHTIPTSELGPEVMGSEVPTVERIRREIDKSYKGIQATGRSSTILEEGFRCLRKNIALADGQRTLVHGDIGLHNMMIDNNKVSALLDWEFAKLGNPADDLGYFYYTADHLFGWDLFLTEYVRAGGVAPPQEQIDFYRLLGLVRVCVFCYQADTMFITGRLPQIQYAPPYNIYLRGTLLRAAKLLENFA